MYAFIEASIEDVDFKFKGKEFQKLGDEKSSKLRPCNIQNRTLQAP